MKVNGPTITTYDAIQKALEQYDKEPDAQNPKKLFTKVSVDLVAISPSKLPKHYTADKLVDVRLGELLGLGVLGAYSQEKLKKGFKVFVGVDDTLKAQVENVLTDGAIIPMDSSEGMSVQQVSAQGYHLPTGQSVEDEIIKQVKYKESRRADYPNKCALLVNVYAPQAGINFHRLKAECNLEAFELYFFAFYLMPKLQECMIVRLNKQEPSDRVTLALLRDPHEHI